jgi:hypothetical protein
MKEEFLAEGRAAKSDCQRGTAWYNRIFGKIGFGIGLALNSIVILTCLPIAVYSFYAPSRPMGWVAFAVLLEVVGLVSGLPMSIVGITLDTNKRYAILGLVLNIWPLPLAMVLLNVLYICGFNIET